MAEKLRVFTFQVSEDIEEDEELVHEFSIISNDEHEARTLAKSAYSHHMTIEQIENAEVLRIQPVQKSAIGYVAYKSD